MATVRVMQEGWGVFQNLPATAARFTEQTGIEVEVTLTVIPEMWELMERSFSGEDPPFDLVGVDDLLLIQAARAGHVEPLDDYIAADGYSLDDFTPQALAAVSDRGQIWGLPYCDVSNVLIYRADLFEQATASPCRRRSTSSPRPRSRSRRPCAPTAPTTSTGSRSAARRTAASTSGWSARPGGRPSARAGTTTRAGRRSTRRSCAARSTTTSTCSGGRARPSRAEMDFMDCVACYAAGRAAMTIEPANEASLIYEEGGAVADGTKTALMPAGPLGTRHVGLYCPPYAIPSLARSKPEAWELAKFLCAPEQVLEDAQQSGFVEVSRNSVLARPGLREPLSPRARRDDGGDSRVRARRAPGHELRDGGRQHHRRRDRARPHRRADGAGGDADRRGACAALGPPARAGLGHRMRTSTWPDGTCPSRLRLGRNPGAAFRSALTGLDRLQVLDRLLRVGVERLRSGAGGNPHRVAGGRHHLEAEVAVVVDVDQRLEDRPEVGVPAAGDGAVRVGEVHVVQQPLRRPERVGDRRLLDVHVEGVAHHAAVLAARARATARPPGRAGSGSTSRSGSTARARRRRPPTRRTRRPRGCSRSPTSTPRAGGASRVGLHHRRRARR